MGAFAKEFVKKEDLTATLRAHQAAIDAKTSSRGGSKAIQGITKESFFCGTRGIVWYIVLNCWRRACS